MATIAADTEKRAKEYKGTQKLREARDAKRAHDNHVSIFVRALDDWAMRDNLNKPGEAGVYSRKKPLERWKFHEKLDASPEIRADSLIKSTVPGARSIISANIIHEKVQEIEGKQELQKDFDPLYSLMEITLLSRALIQKDLSIMIADLHETYNSTKRARTGDKKRFCDIVHENDRGPKKKSLLETAKGKKSVLDLFMKMKEQLGVAQTESERFKVLADMITISPALDYNSVKNIFKKIETESA